MSTVWMISTQREEVTAAVLFMHLILLHTLSFTGHPFIEPAVGLMTSTSVLYKSTNRPTINT